MIDSLAFPALPTAWLWLYIVSVGACVGSFLNVVVHRLPRKLSVVSPPSSCPGCGSRIAWFDNVPVLGWLWLRGRCRACASRISPRYPLVEATAALLAVACVWRFGLGVEALSLFALLAAMLAVALIDWEYMIIPDSISLGFLVLGLLLSPMREIGVVSALIGGVGGGGLLLLVAAIWEKARGVQAMGGGDIKLMAAVGAFLGLYGVLLVIFFGAVLGAIYGVAVLRGGGQAKVAFGTFLSAATFVVVFFGEAVLGWYLRLSGLSG